MWFNVVRTTSQSAMLQVFNKNTKTAKTTYFVVLNASLSAPSFTPTINDPQTALSCSFVDIQDIFQIPQGLSTSVWVFYDEVNENLVYQLT